MNTIAKKIFTLTVLGIAIVSCVGNTAPSGKIIKQERDLTDFNSIALAISADLYLTQGNEFSFRIEGDENFLQEVKTEVNGNTLKIKTDNRVSFKWNDVKVNIYITMPEVEGLYISGSGDIVAETPIISNILSLKVTGSGDISIPNLTLNQLKAVITGSGDLSLAGKTPAITADISVTGSGDVKLKGIVFDNAEVTISGSGDAYVEASKTLRARVSGSGDIVYSGSPTVDIKVSGSGTIRGI